MDKPPVKGSCLCGTVKFQFTGTVRTFQYCHCSRCQKITGSAHHALLFVKPEQFQWLQNADSVTRYELPGAFFYANSFCSKCGSNLPWQSQEGNIIAVPAGALDDDPGIRPGRNIFYESRACWFEPTSVLETFAERPVKPG